MADPDLLDDGGDRPARPPRTPLSGGRRRLVGVAGALAVVVVAGVLAVQADPEPRPAPRPSPASTPYTPAPGLVDSGFTIVDVAATPNRVYVLTGACPGPGSMCRHRLLARTGDGWEDLTALPMPETPETEGIGGRLLISGGSLLVLDDNRSMTYVSTDGGVGFTPHRLRDGPPIPAVPDGLVPEVVYDDSGRGRVGVLDPTTGIRHPLAAQPPVGTLYSVAGGRSAGATVLRAAGERGGRLLVATSPDGGASWRTAEVARVPYQVGMVRLVTQPGDPTTAYLLVSALNNADSRTRLDGVWRTAGPAGRWQRIDWPGTRPPDWMEGVGTPDGGILLADGTSGGWRITRTGTRPLPEPAIDPERAPWMLRRDENGTVVSVAVNGQHLLMRGPAGDSWAIERVPA